MQPVSLVVRWICYGFIGYLTVQQSLELWDRIIGFGPKGLVLLPVLAAAILLHRADYILMSRTIRELKVMSFFSTHDEFNRNI